MNRTRSTVSARGRLVFVLVSVLSLCSIGAGAQTLTSTYRILEDVAVGQIFIDYEATSTRDVNAGLTTVTNRVRYVFPPGDLPDETRALSEIEWISVQQDGSEFPIWWESEVLLSTVSLQPVLLDAVSTWQTLGDTRISGGVIFTRLDFLSPDVAFVTGFRAATATMWALGPPAPIPPSASEARLEATLAAADETILGLESEITPTAWGYRYDYVLRNNSDRELSVDWEVVGLEVELAPGEVYRHSFVSRSRGIERQGYASVETAGSPGRSLVANAVVPDTERRSRRPVGIRQTPGRSRIR